MSDENSEDDGGEITYEINKEDNFRAFWANAYAEFGMANTVQDFLASVEAKVQLSAAFSTSAVGLQIDACLAAVGMEVDFGKKFEAVDILKARFQVTDAEAICEEAEASMIKAEAGIVRLDNELTALKSSLDSFESAGVSLCAPAMQSVL